MQLLVDTDAFCKLAVGGLLHDAATLLGADLSACARLPALPHMLQRGRLRRKIGPDVCDSLLPVARAMPILGEASPAWLDQLAPYPRIDPGEAQIFALAAETGLMVVSGDKRALRALKDISGFAMALHGRIVVLEAILLALCDYVGVTEVRRRVGPLMSLDKVVGICFSSGNHTPDDALASYYRSLVSELDPLVLWNPRPQRGGT